MQRACSWALALWLGPALVPALVPASVGLLACSSSSGESGAPDAHDSTYDPTFTAIYNNILVPSCAQPFCHLGTVNPMPLPDQMTSYQQIVNAQSNGPYCQGQGKRVMPGQPSMSVLYWKVERPSPGNLCGQPMPGAGRTPLEDKQIQQIQQWIMMGAKND